MRCLPLIEGGTRRQPWGTVLVDLTHDDTCYFVIPEDKKQRNSILDNIDSRWNEIFKSGWFLKTLYNRILLIRMVHSHAA